MTEKQVEGIKKIVRGALEVADGVTDLTENTTDDTAIDRAEQVVEMLLPLLKAGDK